MIEYLIPIVGCNLSAFVGYTIGRRKRRRSERGPCACAEGAAWASHLKDHPSLRWTYCPNCGGRLQAKWQIIAPMSKAMKRYLKSLHAKIVQSSIREAMLAVDIDDGGVPQSEKVVAAKSDVSAKTYRVFSDHSTYGLVYEPDLGSVPCKACGGDLRIEARECTNYSRKETVLLRCQSCGGACVAHMCTKEEALLFLKGGTNDNSARTH